MIRRWPVIALIAAVTTVIGCAAPKTSTPAPTAAPTAAPSVVKEITLGYAVALSGPGSSWGINTVNAGEMLFDQYNQAGGVKVGSTTYKFKVKAYDTKYNPAEGLAAVRRLVELDGVRHISITGGALVTAARDYMREKGALSINSMGVPYGFMGPGYPLDFNINIPPETVFRAEMSWVLKENPSFKRAAVMMTDDLATAAAGNMTQAVLKELGLQVVGNETYIRGMTDFSGMLSRLLAQKPDLIATASNPEDEALFVKQAWQMGFRGYYLHPGNANTELMIKTAGQGAEGFMHGSVGEPVPENMAAFQQKYMARYGQWDPVASEWGFLAEVLAEGIKLAGTDDPKSIADVLRTKTINSSIWGPLTYFNKVEGDNWLMHKIPVSVIKGGKNVTVAWVTPQ